MFIVYYTLNREPKGKEKIYLIDKNGMPSLISLYITSLQIGPVRFGDLICRCEINFIII